jgi:hypothetical protein
MEKDGAMFSQTTGQQPLSLVARLPGPGRKRATVDYRYHLTYRNPDPTAVGCVLTWEVHGGRTAYQLAVEREESGKLRLHCTCADSVFRGELEGRFCKHIRGFLESGRALSSPDVV